ncbi:hypothetical protein Anapl_12584 [Anas platyrhynchos]|uniref:Uncharacterized protein n=1 Tax=Anas platyrhynchos TaxID=8839 RepID=R0J8I6_ANAPL|nr:hypothetical protein Anapl_12584 [Anas platyrhynchos]
MKFLFVQVVWCLNPGLVAGGSRLQAEVLAAAAARADLCNLVRAGGRLWAGSAGELYLLLLVLLAGKGFATLRSLLSAAGLCLCPFHRPHVAGTGAAGTSREQEQCPWGLCGAGLGSSRRAWGSQGLSQEHRGWSRAQACESSCAHGVLLEAALAQP